MADVPPEGADIDVDEMLTAPLKLPTVFDPDIPTEDTSLEAVATEVEDRDDEFEAYPEDMDAGSGREVVKLVSVGVVRSDEGNVSTSYKQDKIQIILFQ